MQHERAFALFLGQAKNDLSLTLMCGLATMAFEDMQSTHNSRTLVFWIASLTFLLVGFTDTFSSPYFIAVSSAVI